MTNMSPFWIPLCAAIIGGIFPLLGVVITQYFSFKNNRNIEKQKAKASFLSNRYLNPIFDFLDVEIEFLRKLSYSRGLESDEVLSKINEIQEPKTLSVLSNVKTFNDEDLTGLFNKFIEKRYVLIEIISGETIPEYNRFKIVQSSIDISSEIKRILLNKL
ncbi:hypothetical protein [Xenorhabdus sp. PB62.4]|uniref:hypothetical protein n=1 Tax=Xenorhabdus sp. PB62.4 TaxID=1851573 RepID=UPI0016573007|nr:hypothetical protein [Xenorhabdus sp. PB62.4]MBC8954888.1 hypothetical protein [Xenorhabdus sp. PB62.4]